jgi:transposase
MYTLFRIDPSRGSKVLVEVLGCDCFSAYLKYMREFSIEVQFCLPHRIRDVKFLTTWPEAATRVYAERVLEKLRELFGVIHRREAMTAEEFQRSLERARGELIAVAERAPAGSKAQNLAKRFRLHGDAYLRFITTPGIGPTNNVAEQAMRFVTIDRRITQGTRSDRSRRWCERIGTVIATCAQQGRSAFESLRDAISAYLRNQPIPSLVPDGP